jgi:predicted DNA-binding transcriptional regulator YafY
VVIDGRISNQSYRQALFLARSPQLLDDLGLGKAAEAAFIKLFAAVPQATRRDAESASQRIYVDVSGWNRSEESVPLLPLLQEAVWRLAGAQNPIQVSTRL